ncbi:MAG: tRNA (adenosine(37)-N6)-threonylcarbamoyltransferase complex ATPase subunit type 1 TsaE [Candidatus Spechtbacterales bacterium]
MEKSKEPGTEYTLISRSEEETKAAAARIVRDATAHNPERALVVALEGELGAGKTQFAKGVARALGITNTVVSPTFLVMRRYGASEVSSIPNITEMYHFDCYRVGSEEEVIALGWEDILAKQGAVVVVEWASRIERILPQDTLWVMIESTGPTERVMNVRY